MSLLTRFLPIPQTVTSCCAYPIARSSPRAVSCFPPFQPSKANSEIFVVQGALLTSAYNPLNFSPSPSSRQHNATPPHSSLTTPTSPFASPPAPFFHSPIHPHIHPHSKKTSCYSPSHLSHTPHSFSDSPNTSSKEQPSSSTHTPASTFSHTPSGVCVAT